MFSCNPEHKGIISIIWPDAIVFEDNLPFFLPDSRIIFYSNKPLTVQDSRIIHVTKNPRIDISSREGFLEAVKYVLGGISDWEEKAFMETDPEEFWVLAKSRLVVQLHKNDFSSSQNSSVVKLFEMLFEGFRYTFPIYVNLKVSHTIVVLSLMTMMATSIKPEPNKYSSWYYGILNRNLKHIEHFKKCILTYVESNQSEHDFLSFLHEVYPY